MPRPSLGLNSRCRLDRLALVLACSLLTVLLVAPPARAAWSWPLGGEVITPYGNGDDPYASGQHRGIDIAGDLGAPVAAAAAGVVRFAGTVGSSGLTVSIRTEDGRFDTSYLHLSAIAVSAGQRIAAGEPVGEVGTSGVRSDDRPHLHFGVRDAGSRHAYHDPLSLLPPAPGSPERPRGAPAPSPAPVPLMPAPDPIRVPAERRPPVPRSLPRPHGAPAPGRVPVGDRRRARRRVPVPRGGPSRDHVPLAQPRLAPAADPVPHRLRVGVPALGTGGPVGAPRHTSPGPAAASPVPAGPHAKLSWPPRATSAGPAPGGDPDVGWIAACVGLLAAAAVLGLSEDGRRASRRGGRRLAGLVSPLLGGR